MTSRETNTPYLDSSLPIPARVADLLGRMTLEEKVGQMMQLDPRAVASSPISLWTAMWGRFCTPLPTISCVRRG